jgi:heat shock protein HtpX
VTGASGVPELTEPKVEPSVGLARLLDVLDQALRRSAIIAQLAMRDRPTLRSERGLQARMLLTLALIGALYVVFIAILVAAGVGVVWVAIVAAVLFLVQYFSADKLALSSMRARRVTAHEAPALHAIVERLCIQADLPMPKLGVVETPMANAFAVGRTPSTATVCVTTGLMGLLTESELEAVLAHELTHVINRDVMLMTFAGFFASIAAFIAQLGLFLGPGIRDDDDDAPSFFVVIIISGLVYLVSFVLIQALSRNRELAADRGSALITGRPSALSSALRKISGQLDQIPQTHLRAASGEMAAFYIVSPNIRASVATLFSTHPSLQERLEHLAHLEARLQPA